MSIRTRTLSTTLLVALLPLLALGYVTRQGMSRRLISSYESRVDVLVDAVVRSMSDMDRDLQDRLQALRIEAEADQSLMLALRGMSDYAVYADEFALRGRILTGLDRLMILDDRGAAVALSPEGAAAGHDGGAVIQALRTAPGRRGLLPADERLVLARVDSFTLGGSRFYLVAGFDLDRDDLTALAGGGPVGLSLVYPQGAMTTEDSLAAVLNDAGVNRLASPQHLVPRDEYLTRAEGFPVVAGMGAGPRRTPVPLVPATLLLTHSLAERNTQLRALDTMLLSIVAATVLISVIVAWILSQRLTRPLRRLSRDAEALDLERLDTAFPPSGRDEVGRLAGVLEAMRKRLLAGVEKLRQAERHAVMGDLARQVNHDVRNGFLPIRNVVRHLEDVARDEPETLPAVFEERVGTLDKGLKYLENLAGSWRRLASSQTPAPLDPVEAVQEALAGFPARVEILTPDEAMPRIIVDPTALRRMVQNLVRNALQSLGDEDGRVTVGFTAVADPDASVQVAIRDTGCGLDGETMAHIFEPFYTTRDEGSGLGLAIVRRLAGDAGGDVRVVSTLGEGSVFTLIFPARPDREERP